MAFGNLIISTLENYFAYFGGWRTVSTIIELGLLASLVWVSWKMNKIQGEQSSTQEEQAHIMKRQTQIMSDQQDIMRSKYKPFIRVNKGYSRNLEGELTRLVLDINNQGEGLASHLSLVSEFKIEGGPDLLSVEGEEEKSYTPTQMAAPLYLEEAVRKSEGTRLRSYSSGESIGPECEETFIVEPRYGLTYVSDDHFHGSEMATHLDRLPDLLKFNDVDKCLLRLRLHYQDMVGKKYVNQLWATHFNFRVDEPVQDFFQNPIIEDTQFEFDEWEGIFG